MAQNLILVLDAIKPHWEVHHKALIDASSQSITLPLVISSIKAFGNALRIQHSHSTLRIYLAVGNSNVSVEIPGCKIVSGSIWKAVAQALCLINSNRAKARVLVIQKSSEAKEQEVALNVMVAAQQLKVEIDGLALSECEVLNKTSAFTGGVFMRQSNSAILQTLIQVYLPVNRPRAPIMHFKPYCTCCNKQVERAYVCSYCLAIYCLMQPTCTICQSRLLTP